jgi:O-antigen/teichoic acid export membrane protein
MRTKKSLRNITVTVALQCLSILVSFFARQYFIARLGTEFLGLNGIFDNVLSMLSLAELGFSTAFMFALFRPIAEDDRVKIRLLMKFYRKVYAAVGAVIFLAGLAVIPFLHLFITTVIPSADVIRYYVLYLAAVSVTYLFSYKKTLLIAYQDKYVTSVITYSVFCVLSLVQVLLLYLTGSYALFLAAVITANLCEGIITNAVSDRRYAHLRERCREPVPKEDKAFIAKNVRALFIHKVGGVVISGTDNIVISVFVGLTQVGLYSNYLLVVNAINIIVNQVFTGITASVGNLGTTDDKARYYEVYRVGLYVNALLFIPITIVLWFVVNDFITVWIGGDFVLDSLVLGVILMNFFINGMRRITITYREAQGLYWYDRYKPIIESVINLGVSILLARLIGMAGVFIGTLVSLLATSFWVEPLVLYKHGFGVRLREYFKKYALYVLAGAVSFGAVLALDSVLRLPPSWPAVIGEAVAYGLASVAVFVLLTFRTAEFREIRHIAAMLFGKKRGADG